MAVKQDGFDVGAGAPSPHPVWKVSQSGGEVDVCLSPS